MATVPPANELSEQTAALALIAPMPNEMSPLVKLLGLRRDDEESGRPVYRGMLGETPLVAIRTGIGPELATRATEELLAGFRVRHVIVSGIAGGIEPVSAVGDLLVPEDVVDGMTGDRFQAAPLEGVELAGRIRTGDGKEYELNREQLAVMVDEGITALDMETAAIARVCARHGVPWTAFRAISDMAADESVGPIVMTLVNPDGTPNTRAALRFLLTRPWKIPRMMRLARESNAAASIAAKAAVKALPSAV